MPEYGPGEPTLDQAIEAVTSAIDDLIWDQLPAAVADRLVNEMIRDARVWERLRQRLNDFNEHNIEIVLPADPLAEDAWTLDAAKAHAQANGWQLERPPLDERHRYGTRAYDIYDDQGEPQFGRLVVWELLHENLGDD